MSGGAHRKSKKIDELVYWWSLCSDEDKMLIRSLALTRIQQRAQKRQREMVWVTQSGAPVIIGDQRNPTRSTPARGRRETDK